MAIKYKEQHRATNLSSKEIENQGYGNQGYAPIHKLLLIKGFFNCFNLPFVSMFTMNVSRIAFLQFLGKSLT